MAKLMTANEKKWAVLFSQYKIPEQIKAHGYFEISADQIKEHREPRLMTKFDHKNQLPKMFRENNLAILPIKRGAYLIATFKAYQGIPDIDAGPNDVVPIGFPEHIQSLDYDNITSESAALNCAYVSGMLSDFLQEEGLLPTVSGRMGSGEFSFTVISLASDRFKVSVKNAQIEIDGGYESRQSLTLIEAKNALPMDFIIRQMYYPFRLWRNKLSATKRIRSVFLTFSNGVFTFYEYDFGDPTNYNSLVLKQRKSYGIIPGKITLDDLQYVSINNPIKGEPKGIPFPQADSFKRVINLCEILRQNDTLTSDEVTGLYAFDPRQTDYYANAGRYLGLITKGKSDQDEVLYSLTDAGRHLFYLDLKQRNLEFAKRVLSQRPFRLTFEFFLANRHMPPPDHIVGYMKTSGIYRVGSEVTFRRRASTVAAWVQWILGLTR